MTLFKMLQHGYNTFDDNVATSSAGFDVASLGFDESFTNDIVYFDASVTGNAIANILLGRLNFTQNNTAQIARPLSAYVNYWAGYAQDDFRITPKLTINVGLRYEYEQGLQEKNNQITVGFDRNAASPLQVAGLDLKGGLVYAGVNGAPTQLSRPLKTKFGPRVGFAYALNEKTTIRGGYGVFWAPQVFTFCGERRRAIL